MRPAEEAALVVQPGMIRYEVPPSLRATLAKPLAPVLTTEEAVALIRGRFLVAVGDVCAASFLEAGLAPDVVVVDGRTRRGEARGGPDFERARRVLRARNPAGVVTEEAWEALSRAIASGRPSALVVDGEEDLLALPAVLLAPDGAFVAYGQPPVTDLGIARGGVVVLPVAPGARHRVQQILKEMEPIG